MTATRVSFPLFATEICCPRVEYTFVPSLDCPESFDGDEQEQDAAQGITVLRIPFDPCSDTFRGCCADRSLRHSKSTRESPGSILRS